MFLITILASLANAEPTGQVTTALTVNRIALSVVGQYGIQEAKWEQENNVLRQGTGYNAIGEVSATPAFTRVGGRFTVTPLAILKFQAYGFGTYYFGNFQTIVGYDTADAIYGDNDAVENYVSAESESGNNRQAAGYGWSAGTKATVQAKVSNILFVNTTDFGLQHVVKPDDITGEYTFEREREVMVKMGGDQVLENNTLLLYQIDKTEEKFFRVGNLTTYRHSIEADDTLLRSGLLAIYQKDAKHSHVLIAQHYLQDVQGFTADNADGIKPYVAYAYKNLF